jgi:hypothetical protein
MISPWVNTLFEPSSHIARSCAGQPAFRQANVPTGGVKIAAMFPAVSLGARGAPVGVQVSGE